ncbi:MAG: hypothetical protein V5A54_11050 [Haloarculaceae archaeon]
MTGDVPPGAQCTHDGCEREAVDPDHPAGFCKRHLPGSGDQSGEHDESGGVQGGSPDETPTPETGKRGSNTCKSGDSGYYEIFRRAQALGDHGQWEYVTEDELRQALEEFGHVSLLENGVLAQLSDWRCVDLADDDDTQDWRWYYTPAAPDTRPGEFRRFHELLVEEAPEGYRPYYFRVEQAGKAPATEHGSWKDETNRLTVSEAIEWMEQGGNVGVAGKPDDPLVCCQP